MYSKCLAIAVHWKVWYW